jgi:hypothetical protein
MFKFSFIKNEIKEKIMKNYEYKVIDIDEVGTKEEMYINLLGSQGWELININNEPAHRLPLIYVKLYFKRTVNEKMSEPIRYF